MKRAVRYALAGLLLAAALTSPLPAQELVTPRGWDALRISKWGALGATAAAAIYGISVVQDADAAYERLERACVVNPTVCLQRHPDGSYVDALLERDYQAVRARDRRARNALLGSQLGVVATVVLFVLDLRHARAPADIPYEPPALRVDARADGAVEFRYSF